METGRRVGGIVTAGDDGTTTNGNGNGNGKAAARAEPPAALLTSTGSSGWKLGRRPALDGVRGMALIFVLCCHIAYMWSRDWFFGGYEGLPIFFVLSGFLITSLLLGEKADTQRISIPGFYRRRAMRILPALYVMLVVAFVLSRVLSHVGTGTDTVGQQLEATGAVMAYFYNWLFLGGFAHAGWGFDQSWSLGVEEQFYLLWPLTLMLLLRWRPRWVGRVALAVAALSVLAAVLAHGLWHNYDFAYYSTITNLSGLMLGSYLAWALHRGWSPGRWIRWAAFAGMALIGVVLVSGPPWTANPLLWGDWPIDLAAAAIILAVLDGTGPLGRLFSLRPLRYLGEISYSVYVWHFLVISCVLLLAPRMNPAIQIFLVLYVSLIVAMASHSLLEVPFIRRAHRGGWQRQKTPGRTEVPVEWRARHLRPSPAPSTAVQTLSVDTG